VKEEVKISVAIITYNQEKTIAQTLDGVICQEGDFCMEVVIGEDCSIDNTWKICNEYALKYPNVVRLLPNEHNLGIMANFARVIEACTGDYVAICAGDDYWCDEQKLQKQLTYFQQHPDIGVVSTAGYKLLVKRNQLVPNAIAPIHPIADGNIKPFYFSSSYRGGVYAMPLSLLIKRDVLRHVDFDEFVARKFPVEDYPMQAILSQYTHWGHIPDNTVVYRVYQESATFISFDHPKYLDYHKGLMNIRRYLNQLFPADACMMEEQMQNYEFYKEFLLYLHRRNYAEAKRLVESAPELIHNTAHYLQAKRAVKTKSHFYLFHVYKEIMYHKEINKRT